MIISIHDMGMPVVLLIWRYTFSHIMYIYSFIPMRIMTILQECICHVNVKGQHTALSVGGLNHKIKPDLQWAIQMLFVDLCFLWRISVFCCRLEWFLLFLNFGCAFCVCNAVWRWWSNLFGNLRNATHCFRSELN